MAKFRILELCKQKGITQKELAESIGMTPVGLAKAANGNPTVETLEKIADGLNVGVTDLFCSPNDFIALIRYNGDTHTFENLGKLKEYVNSLNED